MDNYPNKNQDWMDVLSKYFEPHIRQRFIFFNYYIVIFSSLVVAAYLSHNLCNSSIAKIVALLFLGLVMTAAAFIFYMFEIRVKFLISRCNKRLIEIEKIININQNLILFENEKVETLQEKEKIKIWKIPVGHFFSYSKCVNWFILTSWIAYIMFLFFLLF